MAPRTPQPADASGRDDVVSVEALPGGLANRAVLVTTRGSRFVVRTHERAHILGANARRREVQLQTLAAGAGLAPRVLWASEQGDVLVTEYAAGRVWSAHDTLDRAQLRRLCAVWRALRALPAPPLAPFDGAATATRYRSLVRATGPEDASGLDAATGEAVQLTRTIAAEGRVPAIVHGDPHHANVVDDGTHLKLVDWEYASLADPLADPGCLLAYYPPARAYAAEILEWSGLSASADAAALERVRRLYELLAMLWERAMAAPSGAQGPESAD